VTLSIANHSHRLFALLDEGAHLIGFRLYKTHDHRARTAWELGMQILGNCVKAGHHEVHDPPETHTNGPANTMQGDFLQE
jgi:hypothetical protein